MSCMLSVGRAAYRHTFSISRGVPTGIRKDADGLKEQAEERPRKQDVMRGVRKGRI